MYITQNAAQIKLNKFQKQILIFFSQIICIEILISLIQHIRFENMSDNFQLIWKQYPYLKYNPCLGVILCQIFNEKLAWHAEAKVRSFENIHYQSAAVRKQVGNG